MKHNFWYINTNNCFFTSYSFKSEKTIVRGPKLISKLYKIKNNN